jgi:hypothetical protein
MGLLDDAMAIKSRPNAKKKEESGEFVKGIKRGIDQTQGLGYGLVAMAGDAIGSDELKEAGHAGYQRNLREADENAAKVAKWEDIRNWRDGGIGDAIDYVAGGLGEVIPSIATTVAGGGVGGFVGKQIAKKAVQKGIKKQVEKRVGKGMAKQAMAEGKKPAVDRLMNTVGKKAIKKGADRGEMAGATLTSVGLESAETYENIYEKTGKEELGTALTFGTARGMLDSVLPMAVLKKLKLNRAGQKTAQRDIWQKAVAKGMVSEGSTEAAQELLGRAAVEWVDENHPTFDKEGEWFSELSNAFLKGGMGGGVMSGAAHGVQAGVDKLNGVQPPATIDPVSGMPFQQLNNMTLDEARALSPQQVAQQAQQPQQPVMAQAQSPESQDPGYGPDDMRWCLRLT